MLDVNPEYSFYLWFLVVVSAIRSRWFSCFDENDIPVMVLDRKRSRWTSDHILRNKLNYLFKNYKINSITSIILMILDIESKLSFKLRINVTLKFSSSFFFASAIDSKINTSSSPKTSSAKSLRNFDHINLYFEVIHWHKNFQEIRK